MTNIKYNFTIQDQTKNADRDNTQQTVSTFIKVNNNRVYLRRPKSFHKSLIQRSRKREYKSQQKLAFLATLWIEFTITYLKSETLCHICVIHEFFVETNLISISL